MVNNHDVRFFVSWSGGKDSCLALHRTLQQGHQAVGLLSMLHEEGEVSRSHGIPRELLCAQATSLGLPIHFGKATWEDYEPTFKDLVRELRESGAVAGVFGDIDIREHREWVERVCGETNITPLLPLWGEDRTKLVEEFLHLGFRAIIVSLSPDRLPRGWLGRNLEPGALEELRDMGVDVAGEGGEFHTFVFDGPLFSEAVRFGTGGITEQRGYLQLALRPAQAP